ncbi:NEW3 domain-containing protein [Labedaea rhizosphaerae]|uniref:Alpha-galactosidase-like protein n=1 Tax=Labedaea rhizosphaerae TaxID=598644 RepID=A0A4R6S0U6_LABRH|nr:NEW3 domain-containing protein [Labedaea rhizosphaerae]TDP92235.1 alpha-galactosidase-like protein [Labedaea rhizosphaerae]
MRVLLGAASIAAILGTGIVVTPASAAAALPPNQILGLFDSSYASIAARVSHLGYAPTSLTGTYGAMYTRDASVQAMALTAAGDTTRAEAILSYVLRYSAASGQAQLPHRIYDTKNVLTTSRQADVSQRVYDLSVLPRGATQAMPVPGTVSAVDVWLSRGASTSGKVRATLIAGTGSAAQTVDSQTIPIADVPTGSGGWVTVEFRPPLTAEAPTAYSIKLAGIDSPAVTWWGAGAGKASYQERTTDFRLSGYDMFDETDQLFSVALAWARVFPKSSLGFRYETWPLIRGFVDYYLSTPGYFNTSMNLIRNPILDDEGYHNTYDLLTNVFTAQALHELAPIADGYLDPATASRYRQFAAKITRGINANLVTTVDGNRIYGEKYEIGSTTVFSPGYSFVNLSPLAAGWYGMDDTIMANTVQAYFAHESKNWSGVTMLSSMQDYGGSGHNRWVLTKSFSWELRFAAKNGDTGRVGEIDTFLQRFDPDIVQPIAEGWILDDTGTVTMTDPANQEHASWYLLGLLQSYPRLAPRSASISQALKTTPELTVSMPAHVTAAFTVNSTLFNTLASSSDFTVSADAPSGWTVSTTSAVDGTLRAGDSAPVAWTVTPPPGYSGPVDLTVSARLGGHTVTKHVFTTVANPA